MTWSAPIQHTGCAVPHLVGKRVRAMLDDGSVDEPRIHDGQGGSWTWRDLPCYRHVVSYQVWQEPVATEHTETETLASTKEPAE